MNLAKDNSLNSINIGQNSTINAKKNMLVREHSNRRIGMRIEAIIMYFNQCLWYLLLSAA